jgi:hypothetical protein
MYTVDPIFSPLLVMTFLRYQASIYHFCNFCTYYFVHSISCIPYDVFGLIRSFTLLILKRHGLTWYGAQIEALPLISSQYTVDNYTDMIIRNYFANTNPTYLWRKIYILYNFPSLITYHLFKHPGSPVLTKLVSCDLKLEVYGTKLYELFHLNQRSRVRTTLVYPDIYNSILSNQGSGSTPVYPFAFKLELSLKI